MIKHKFTITCVKNLQQYLYLLAGSKTTNKTQATKQIKKGSKINFEHHFHDFKITATHDHVTHLTFIKIKYKYKN